MLNATVASDPLAEVVNSADPVAVWKNLPLASRRVLLDRLCTVTILPAGRRGQGFDRSTVRVDEKHHLGKPVG